MNHPTETELQQFAKGELDEQRFEEVAAHVESCKQCAVELEKSGFFPDLIHRNDTILQCIAKDLPSIPRVILRDDNLSTQGIVRPNSTEMPVGNHGRYQIQGEVARGGMGAILKGRDTDLGRDLAIKVLLADHKQKPEVLNRFIEEAQIGGQLQHPGIVPVYELGQFNDQRPFFTMKLVKGETLAAILAERQNVDDDRMRLLGIFEQVCQTMAYAHSKGVIHRDLKPANIMVGAFGEVQVMDWGLAKVLQKGGIADEKKSKLKESLTQHTVIRTLRTTGSDTPGGYGSATNVGSVMGTPAYMPPEQALGEVDQLDERADVFSLGSMLCQILTGKPAYADNDPQQVYRMATRGKLQGAFARLESTNAGSQIIDLCKACLSPEPTDRPRDAAVVTAKATAYLESVETRLRESEIQRAAESARLEEAQKTAREERRRRRATLATAAAVLLAVMIGTGSWAWIQNQKRAIVAAIEREAIELTQKIGAKLTGAERLLEESRTNPDVELELLRQARDLAKEAEALVRDHSSQPKLVVRTEAILTTLDSKYADRRLVSDLTELLDTGGSYNGRSWAGLYEERVEDRYAELFESIGLSPKKISVEQAVRRIRSRSNTAQAAIQAGLEEWKLFAKSASSRAWLYQVIGLIDAGDPWRMELRKALESNDKPAFEQLAETIDLKRQPPLIVRTLAEKLPIDSRVELLRSAQLIHPQHFWINFELSRAFASSGQKDDALRYATAAVAIRPVAIGHMNLGFQLWRNEKHDEAVSQYQEVTRLRPDFFWGHYELASALSASGRDTEAIDAYRACLKTDPRHLDANPYSYHSTYASAHRGLADLLRTLDKRAAQQHYYAAIKLLGLQDAYGYRNLSLTLDGNTRQDEAFAAVLRAAELRVADLSGVPGFGDANRLRMAYHLESTGKIEQALVEYYVANEARELRRLGVLDEAIAQRAAEVEAHPDDTAKLIAFSRLLHAAGEKERAMSAASDAVQIAPEDWQTQLELAQAHYGLGQMQAANEAYNRASELRHPDGKLVFARPASIGMAKSLRRILNGEETLGPSRLTTFIDLCLKKELYASGANLIDVSSEWTALGAYNAACICSMAAEGKGDASEMDSPTKNKLRNKAVAFLKLAFSKRKEELRRDPVGALPKLGYWLVDPELAAVRDSPHLERLAQEEKQEIESFWSKARKLYRSLGGISEDEIAKLKCPGSNAVSISGTGLRLHNSGKFEEAEKALRETLDVKRQLFSDQHPAVAFALTDLGELLRDVGPP